MRVIVAEADELTRMLLLGALSGMGHECRQAADGLEAWRLMRAESPDVLIAAWDLPGMDGLELAARVRGAERRHSVQVIVATDRQRRSDARTAMEAGVDDLLAKPVDLQELECRMFVAARVSALHRTVSARHDELELMRREAVDGARHDRLTQLWNRAQLAEDMPVHDGRLQRYGHDLTLAVVGIDAFGSHHVGHGSAAGDRVVVEVADVLRESLRAGDTVYRYGADEFLVVLTEHDADDAMVCIRRVREQVRDRAASPVQAITLSVGVAQAGSGACGSFSQALRAAEAAMQEARRRGRDRDVVAPGPGDDG